MFPVHRVNYSIGLAGKYLLHVRLRKEAMPVAGSPFELTVLPGPAHGHTSFLAKESQKVNNSSRLASITLYTRDVMGNKCIHGGADIHCSCNLPGELISFEIKDGRNGSYQIEWFVPKVEKNEVYVKIGETQVIGSPLIFEGSKQPKVEHTSPERRASLPSVQPSVHQAIKPRERRRNVGLEASEIMKDLEAAKKAAVNPLLLRHASHISTKALTKPQDPVQHTRRRMSMGYSGLSLPPNLKLVDQMVASLETKEEEEEEAEEAAAKLQAVARGRRVRVRAQNKPKADVAQVEGGKPAIAKAEGGKAEVAKEVGKVADADATKAGGETTAEGGKAEVANSGSGKAEVARAGVSKVVTTKADSTKTEGDETEGDKKGDAKAGESKSKGDKTDVASLAAPASEPEIGSTNSVPTLSTQTPVRAADAAPSSSEGSKAGESKAKGAADVASLAAPAAELELGTTDVAPAPAAAETPLTAADGAPSSAEGATAASSAPESPDVITTSFSSSAGDASIDMPLEPKVLPSAPSATAKVSSGADMPPEEQQGCSIQ